MPQPITFGQDSAKITLLQSLLPLLSAQLQEENAVQCTEATIRAVIKEIRNAGNVFHLNEPVQVSLFCENALYYCESKPLSILSFGRTQREAVSAFNEDFAMMWDVIAQSPDDDLTLDAKAVKDKLQALVNSVVQE